MQNAGLDKAQVGIKIARRNINNFRYADDTTLMAESEEKLKSFLVSVKEKGEKASLKLHVNKTNIMASRIIASWGKIGNNDRFYFLGLQISLRMVSAAMKLKDVCSLE